MADKPGHTALDQKEFERLFKTHFAYLCKFARQYIPDEDTAQDICQGVFIRLWEKRAEMNPRKSIKSYLFTAVRNRCLNYIRDHKKYRSRILDLECGEIDFASEDEDHFAEAELRARIEQALDSLPEKCRLVFEMSRYRQMKYQEIADELGIALKTVEAHMSKALKALKEALRDYRVVLALLMMLLWEALK